MPRRWACCTILFALTAAALAQPPGAGDDLTYRDRGGDGKLIDVKADTKESAAGVQIIVAGKAKALISPADVVRYDYGSLPGTDLAALAVTRSMERGGDLVKAQAGYADLLKKLPATAPEKTRRHLTFREALVSARLADGKTGEEFAAEADRATAKLTAAFRLAKKNWEAWPAATTAARLHSERGQFDKAAALYGELAAIPELPRDLKYEARLDEAAALVRARQGLAADAVLDDLEKDGDFPAGPLKERLAVLRVVAKASAAASKDPEATAKLQAAIDQAKDPAARALGYNFLGDSYVALGQNREAMWSYLWVDTVYNQDKDEQVQAVHRLIALFEQTGDKDRADQFRGKLPRVR